MAVVFSSAREPIDYVPLNIGLHHKKAQPAGSG